MEQVYTLKETAALLKVSIATIKRLINDGRLTASRVRVQLRITESEIARYLSSTRGE